MGDKTVESVEVSVDEDMLAPLGWAIPDVRARLVTKRILGSNLAQSVSVAGTAQFIAEDWTDRFKGTGRAPHVLVALGCHARKGLSRLSVLIEENAEGAAKRPTRFTETSDMWIVTDPIAAADLTVRITGYDLDRPHQSFGLPEDPHTLLPVTVIDESTRPSMRVHAMASAEITGHGLNEELRLNVDGIIELGSPEELKADRRAPAARLDVPGFVVEVTDDSDFLLLKRTIKFDGTIVTDEQAGTPRRSPAFVAGFHTGVGDFAGTAAQVTLRVRDAADIQLI
ncbi:hypothetical protein [Actinoplanes derwentensis]|uniref:Uncharacterized protein n=1 Tax=Actinoplanes derwentensis TaxID=113562 RepID=A0A1H1SG82_9ACTN|nr:hypothetical protein [Actinoplanes derwentensis]GID83310.1 hypothetical protein Ade03nite_22340 [Actinoplanes derwentensis]SDS47005.1 hypothetical protein SAMN04489716_0852 [Actinoplanes derwentensis]